MTNSPELSIDALRNEIQLRYKERGQSFLNNFHDKLPMGPGVSIEIMEQWANIEDFVGHSRATFIVTRQLDIPNRDREPRIYLPLNPEYTFSERYLNQTAREFFKTIDEVIEDLGIELPLQKPTKFTTEFAEFSDNTLIRIYTRLREVGYNHRELTS